MVSIGAFVACLFVQTFRANQSTFHRMAHRAFIDTSKLNDDPDLRPLVDNPEVVSWLGPGRHVTGFLVVRFSFNWEGVSFSLTFMFTCMIEGW